VLLREWWWSFVREKFETWLEILYHLDDFLQGKSFERRE
jgi:hypothetical protein